MPAVLRKNKPTIHQFHSGSGVADAVTNSMFFIQSILHGFGCQSEIFVEHLDATLGARLRRLEELHPAPNDILLVHHSMGHDAVGRVAALRCRKFLIYHNITPPEYLDGQDRDYAAKGYGQLSDLRDIVEAAIAISPFNAKELARRGFANTTVLPLLKDFAAIRNARHAKFPYYDDAARFRLLFVGRIAPHKCQHELVDFVARAGTIGDVRLDLVLVGHATNAAYRSRLDAQIRDAGLGSVIRITGPVADDEVFGWYRAASAYLSLSEHEGFGVPLIEAMALDLPVVAYASSGVADTLGGCGIALTDKDPTAILDTLIRLRRDRRFRADIIRTQRKHTLRFSRQRLETEFGDWLAELGALDRIPRHTIVDDVPALTERTHYLIEGPYETSYSLSIVNRNLARALAASDAKGASIEPADGTEGYAVDAIAAARLPAEIQNLVRPAPLSASGIVTIRNTWPCRPNGLLGDLRLVHLAWEESALPEPFSELINLHLDGVLAPSNYVKRAIRNSGVRVPIGVIGHGVDHDGAVPQRDEARATRGPTTNVQPFTFLHISSGFARKGIEELLTAYCLAFSRADPVLLVIKTTANPENIVDAWVARLIGNAKHAPSIQLIDDQLDRRQMDFLYDVADAIVLPSRGEGFNLPAAEALSRGLPVIATRHSGHLDFLNDANSCLIECRYEMSDSRFKIANSYWARPDIDQLVAALKTVYRSTRRPDAVASGRALQGQVDAARLSWAEVAGRVNGFVEELEHRPVITRRLRLAWISTYNARCGIATHSAHLLEFFDHNAFDITIFADDQERVGPDPDNVIRLWSKDRGGLTKVCDHIVAQAFDVVLFQHNFRFYDSAEFAETILALTAAGIDAYVILHRTTDLAPQTGEPLPPRTVDALRACTRVFVHSIDDVNRLHEWGVADNVALLAHGVIEREPLDAGAVQSLIGLSACYPVIGSFGFMLPGKGLPELIHAFALVLKSYPSAFLLLVNADYPQPASQGERKRCLALIKTLEIEDRVRLVDEFLEIDEALFFLSACNTIVYPYQRSLESASGAVRFGLAAGRPVVTTPLPVFADLADIVSQLDGTSAIDIADGILGLLQDETRYATVVERQRDWVRANSWGKQATRIANIVIGCFEDKHSVELRAPLDKIRIAPASPTTGNGSDGNSEVARLEQVPTPVGDEPPLTGAAPRNWRRLGLFRRNDPRHAAKKAMTQGDRARDRRNWPTAARYYREALDLQPDNPGIWVQFGHALKEAGDVPAAEQAYRRSLNLAGEVADTYLQLGHALKLQGRKSEAGSAYLHALALDPALSDAAAELRELGWTRGLIELRVRRERSAIQ